MSNCPLHKEQADTIDNISVTMAQIANNILWITNIGKWALATAGAIILVSIGLAANFNEKLVDVSISVKQSEVMIANLIEDNKRISWDGE